MVESFHHSRPPRHTSLPPGEEGHRRALSKWAPPRDYLRRGRWKYCPPPIPRTRSLRHIGIHFLDNREDRKHFHRSFRSYRDNPGSLILEEDVRFLCKGFHSCYLPKAHWLHKCSDNNKIPVPPNRSEADRKGDCNWWIRCKAF